LLSSQRREPLDGSGAEEVPKTLGNALEAFLDDPRNALKWPDEEERRAVGVALTSGPESDTYDFIVQLDEGAAPEWVHLLTYGTLVHPYFGEMEITEEKVTNYVTNFRKKVRGTMLDIDYAHKNDPAKGNKAAGWVIALEQREDGLWGKISWTSEAAKEIADGAWKYMSVEFEDKWCTTKEPIQCYDDVLFGAALTNRPFVKDLTPINFEDFFTTPPGKFTHEDAYYRMASDSMYRCSNCVFFRDSSCLLVDGEIDGDYTCDYFKPIYNDVLEHMYEEPQEEVNVEEFLKKLRATLELAEDASEEEVLKALEEGLKKPDPPPPEDKPQLSDEDKAKAKKFAEDYPEEAARMVALEESNRRLDTETKLGEWRKGEKGGIPTALDESIIEYRTSLRDPSKFDDIMSSIVKTGLVPLDEKGGSRRPKNDEDGESPSDEFLAAVKKYQEEHEGMSFQDATRAVSKANPELARKYLQDVPRLSGAAEEEVD